jgi:L-fuculose-phosphate aldolase
VALRSQNIIAITPSGIDYDRLKIDDISLIDFDGHHIAGEKPSSEWYLHLALYKQRPEINAVVHTHSRFATTLALLHKPLPACHYLIGVAGCKEIRVAPYATFGTPELAEKTMAALGASDRCILMANHGLIAIGNELEQAYNTALYIEEVAELYHRALTIGDPVILSDKEMEEALIRFQSYGHESQN